MAVQKNITPGTATAIFAKIPNGHSADINKGALLGSGSIDMAKGMVTLVRGVPFSVTPSVDASIVQNTMEGRSQLLYVSEHGNMDGAWLSVPGMSCIEFAKNVYLMQMDFDEYAFPIANK